jgi:hypothetical protein
VAATGLSAVQAEVAAKVEAWWDTTAPSGVEAVSRVPQKVEEVDGRRVRVFRLARKDVTTDRGEDAVDYTIGLWVVERFVDSGEVPEGWVTERVKWTEELYEMLRNPRAANLLAAEGDPDSGLWAEDGELVQACDHKAIGEHAAFSAAIAIVYREIVRP